MKLHEIISSNEELTTSIEVGQIFKYKRSLMTYYKSEYCNGRYAPILMITSVFNACQYAKIVCEDDFLQTVSDYVDTLGLETEQDKENEIELINFQSILLEKL